MDPARRVVFVCVENSARSQMAEGFLKEIAPYMDVQSAGTRPCAQINPDAVLVMRESGIDISEQVPKLVTAELTKNALMINMGCMQQDACPALMRDDVEDWQIEDPGGKDIEQMRRIRDQIRRKVRELLAKMDG